MIDTMIFDLDGTLMRTERLKALSWASAVRVLCRERISVEEVLEQYKDFVGLTRAEVAKGLLDRFGIEEAAGERMKEHNTATPWQAFIQIRLPFYRELISDPELLRANVWPHNFELLKKSSEYCAKVGLATMSQCAELAQALNALDIEGLFDFVASVDDVEHGKPDPAIYTLVADELGSEPDQCLVIEDSPSGIEAALGAGMHCVAVTTDFTRERVHAAGLLPESRIVDNPSGLADAVKAVIYA